MPNKTPPPRSAFNAPHQPPAPGVMGMVVDLQLGCFGSMEPDVTQDYLARVATALGGLRERGIPVCWLTMAEHSKLSPPKGGAVQLRSMGELEELEFFSILQENDSQDVYMDFLTQHGPRTNEAVFCKYFFDAFTDMRGKPDAKEQWEAHKNIRPVEYQQSFDRMNAVLQGPPLINFMRQQGVRHIVSFGGISTNCVLSTALGAARHGIGATICTDLLISLRDHHRARTPSWYEEELAHALQSKTRNAVLIEKLEFTTFSDYLYTLSSDEEPQGPAPRSKLPGPRAS